MRVSEPPLLRRSALLPFTGATTFHVPAWWAKVTRSFCWTLVLIGVRSPGEVQVMPSSPNVTLRGVEGDAGEARVICRPAMADGSASGLLGSEGRSKGDSLELRWYSGLKTNEPENTTVRNCFTLNPLSSGLIANLTLQHLSCPHWD